MQEQNSEKTVALAVKTGKMSEKVLKDCMKAFLASQKNKSPKVYKGKRSVKQLTLSGAQLTNIEVTDQNIKAFDKTARKYGIDYALKKDIAQEPPKYFVFFNAKYMEVVIISRNTELENTRIVQIVQLSNLNVSQLKDMLAKIKYNTFSSTSITSIPLTKIERKYFFMKKH